MKTLHEKAQAYFDGLKTVFIDVIGVEKSSQLQQLKVLELFTPNAFMAGYETHLHETRWRSVEGELPEEGMEVLVQYSDLRVFMACYENPEFGFTAYEPSGQQCYALKDGAITHWKPIE